MGAVDDRRRAVQRKDGSQPPVDLGDERTARWRSGGVELGEPPKALRIRGPGVAERHPRNRRGPSVEPAVARGLTTPVQIALTGGEECDRPEVHRVFSSNFGNQQKYIDGDRGSQ